MSDRSSSQETSRERSPWSRPGVLLSGAFLIALALLGIVLAATGGGLAAASSAKHWLCRQSVYLHPVTLPSWLEGLLQG